MGDSFFCFPPRDPAARIQCGEGIREGKQKKSRIEGDGPVPRMPTRGSEDAGRAMSGTQRGKEIGLF